MPRRRRRRDVSSDRSIRRMLLQPLLLLLLLPPTERALPRRRSRESCRPNHHHGRGFQEGSMHRVLFVVCIALRVGWFRVAFFCVSRVEHSGRKRGVFVDGGRFFRRG